MVVSFFFIIRGLTGTNRRQPLAVPLSRAFWSASGFYTIFKKV